MNNRQYGEREAQCHYWDGKTEYKAKESIEEEEKRLEDFGKWLEEQQWSLKIEH